MNDQNNNTPDRKVLACNFAEGTSECSKGALAYVYNNNPGWAGERMRVFVRSRSGRWIVKWESLHRLCNFRFKTIPPESPQYRNLKMQSCLDLGDRLFGHPAMPQAYNSHANSLRGEKAA